jgi:hypothetical protein
MNPLEWPAPGRPPYFYILGPGRIPVPERNVLTYGEFCEKDENVRVGLTWIGDVQVSTVFIGTASPRHDPPKLFETMVFGGRLHHARYRYHTWEQAEEGHRLVVDLVEASQKAKP